MDERGREDIMIEEKKRDIYEGERGGKIERKRKGRERGRERKRNNDSEERWKREILSR